MFGWFKKEPEVIEKTPQMILAEKMVRLEEVDAAIIECTQKRKDIHAEQLALTKEYELLKKELGYK